MPVLSISFSRRRSSPLVTAAFFYFAAPMRRPVALLNAVFFLFWRAVLYVGADHLLCARRGSHSLITESRLY